MNPWLRRLLILIVVMGWLSILMLPTMAFVLARSGQLQIGDSGGRHWRLFLIQEARTEGLGLERAGPVAPPLDAPAAACLQTSVDYWMWTGEGEDALYCTCLDPATGSVLPVTPPSCRIP